MMLRELGLSALFLFSLLASTAVAEPDTRINLKIEAEAKTESVRLATQIDYLVQPIDYTMNGNFEALTVGCLEDGVEVTSDAAEKVSFSARKGFNYLYTQLYASQDPTTGELIPFEDPVYFQAYGNQPQLPSQFDLKSPLAADAIIGAARLPVARIQTKLLKAVQAKKEEKIAGSPILPYSVIKMRPIKVLEQEAVPLDAPFNRSVSPFDEFINMIADAVGASADSPGTATRINADPIAAVVECQTAIPLDVAVPEKELAFKFRSRGIFEQQAVFRAETGEMFAFDQSTGRIAIAKGLSQDQEFTNPDQDYPQCGPIKYSAPVFIIANTEAEEAAGAAAIVSADNIPLLTMMIECEHGSSFALALSP